MQFYLMSFLKTERAETIAYLRWSSVNELMDELQMVPEQLSYVFLQNLCMSYDPITDRIRSAG